MGLGIYVKGELLAKGLLRRRPTFEQWAPAAEQWWQAHAAEVGAQTGVGQDYKGRATLFVRLHPSAENVEIISQPDGTLIASAKTSTTGAGYHVYLVEQLERLGRATGVRWSLNEAADDETGYFAKRDAAAVRAEMLRWLKVVAGSIRQEIGKGATNLMMSMAMHHYYEVDGALLTPLGPRGREWLDGVIADPARGEDFFAWPEPGPGPTYLLGRALYHMWSDVRWRRPVDESEVALLTHVCD